MTGINNKLLWIEILWHKEPQNVIECFGMSFIGVIIGLLIGNLREIVLSKCFENKKYKNFTGHIDEIINFVKM